MQFVLGRAHEELKERNQTPSVAGEQLVPEALFHFFDILDKSNPRVILVQERITLGILAAPSPQPFCGTCTPRGVHQQAHCRGTNTLHTSGQSTDSWQQPQLHPCWENPNKHGSSAPAHHRLVNISSISMYVHITYNTKTCTYIVHTCTYKYEPVYTCIYNVCTYNEACTYLTISA